MILLAVIAALLYLLGCVLANELAKDLERDTPAKRITVIVFWPSLAVFLLVDALSPD